MSSLSDPIANGLASGWKVLDAHTKTLAPELHCDVAIIGTGAGGATTADALTKAGLRVIMIEEGGLRSSRDFKQLESDAYPQLYQESAARKTRDKGITILQGRTVGGSTTVNWTSSFRTPEATLAFWRNHFGLKDLRQELLQPFFEAAERRLHISQWEVPPNPNNEVLLRGAQKLGIATGVISRNVQACWNLGSCGLGCPTNAKQSMLLTTIPDALNRGAQLLVNSQAWRFEFAQGGPSKQQHIQYLLVRKSPLPGQTFQPNAHASKVIAKHYILAGGAIQSPALLLRSQAPDPYQRLGKRTFLHPTLVSAALMPETIAPWSGAPQTIYSDHFLHTQDIDGPLGYKLEVAPVHPVLFASTVTGMGHDLAQFTKEFARSNVMLALLRDGFSPDSQGGTVGLRDDGSPELDYPVTDLLLEGARRALLSMAEIQFAAGAKSVMPLAENAQLYTNWQQAKQAIEQLPLTSPSLKVVSAHVMGGCALSAEENKGVCRPDARHWQIDNLSIHDGSIFPTSLGANPQLSIYGIVAYLTQGLLSERFRS